MLFCFKALVMVLSMNKWKGKVAVVTGASSGIGEAVVKKLVEEGLIVSEKESNFLLV